MTPDFFTNSFWPWATVTFLVDLGATCHIVLNKRDNRAALGWVGLVWFTPLVGSILYFLFGINRVQRKARRLRRNSRHGSRLLDSGAPISPDKPRWHEIQELVSRLTSRPLTYGNRVLPLLTGEAVYAEMLNGIESAGRSIGLSTYIFDNDQTGRTFAEALGRAVKRGVAVRVLIDDIGSRYTFPSIVRRLREIGVQTTLFLPSLLPWRFAYAHLRTHRKILVIDGQLGFLGGMNIRDGHDARTQSRHPIMDCHFRIEGPVVSDLRSVFADDWSFANGERLTGGTWFPALKPAGDTAARGIPSGPDDDFGLLTSTFLGAIACARQSIRIVSPYFVPDRDLVSALCTAALRGVRIEILVPEKNNLRLVHWAMMGQIGQLLDHGCRVWLTPPPFDHSKLFLVDEEWSLIGSANWDSRSLRLNFEFDVECYDRRLNQELGALISHKTTASSQLTRDALNRRNLFFKLRDGIARLASPYL